MATQWQLHKHKWEACRLCDLCETRKKVCLLRGSIPCDVLFIGEAPGLSEDVMGVPFVGPAGHLINHIVETALPVDRENDGELPQSKISLAVAFTNLVGCIPKGPDNRKSGEPEAWAIEACRPRVVEVIKMCRPRLIVLVGKLAQEHVTEKMLAGLPSVTIDHPAYILRADVTQRGLLVQRAVVALSDAVSELQ